MKTKNRILSFTSILLVAVYLAGSAGVLIVKHTCSSCGLSEYHTEFFSAESAHDGCNCSHESNNCHSESGENMEAGCCSFQSDKLTLTDNLNSKVYSISISSIPAVINESITSDDLRLNHKPLATICNKHGGRDIIRQTCQLLI